MTTVTAVLVARNGAKYLPATLAALAAQTRRPDRVLAVDAGSSDGSLRLLQDGLLGAMVASARRGSVAQVADQLLGRAPSTDAGEWYWFLGHDNAPHPRALEALLGAVEVSPSVLVAGPKLMRWDERGVIQGFGEAITTTGASVQLVIDELDQSQHDAPTDVLGVAVPGMLVQAALWHRLDGFDPGLPSVDAGLDFGIRARLAGARVERVPRARVSSAGPVELFGRSRVGAGARNRIRRAAQLHRGLAYSAAWMVPLLWLATLPVALARAAWQVLAKRPGLAPGEIGAGFQSIFDGTVIPARRVIASARATSWSAIAPFRLSGRDARELRDRAVAVEQREGEVIEEERPSFFAAGGGWAVLAAAVVSLVVFWRLLGQPAIAGGALAPLGALGDLWSALGVQARLEDGGFVGASDPFHAVLAILGSASWWSPDLAIIVATAAAMPLAALSAWFAAARFSSRGWAPAIAAVAWAVAPPLLAALGGGELGAVIAHVLLPWLAIAVLDARRSWSMAAVAALLFAAVTASAPVLAPGLVILLIALVATRPKAAGRLVAIVIPPAALAGALIWEQLARSTPLALLADPGVPVARDTPRLLALLLGSPTADYAGWHGFFSTIGQALGIPDLAAIAGPLVLAIVVAPLGVLAVLATFFKGGMRAVSALVVAAVGLLTAVGASIVHLTATPSGDTASVWPGSGLSLYWLGLVLAATVALDALGRFAAGPAIVTLAGVVLAGIPLGFAAATGATDVQPSSGRVLPALVAASGEADPGLGTLDLTASDDADFAAVVQRGSGLTEERITTLQTTNQEVGPDDAATAELVANLVSDSGADVGAALEAESIRYILLRDANADSPAHARALAALAGDPAVTPIGPTPQGMLWEHGASPSLPAATSPGPWGTPIGAASNVLQIVVFAFFGLLAIPTARRRGVRAARGRDADLIEDGGEEE